MFRGVKDIIDDKALSDVQKEHTYVIGVDLGKHQDFTVITVIDLYNNKVVHIDRFNELDWNMQKARITATAKRYNNARIILDSTGVGDPISDDLKRAGYVVDDFRYTNKSKQQLIEKLSIFIEQKMLNIPNNEMLLDELSAFGYSITDSGNMTYSAPEGAHDDMVNSLGLAVWGLAGEARPVSELQKELNRGKIIRHNSVV